MNHLTEEMMVRKTRRKIKPLLDDMSYRELLEVIFLANDKLKDYQDCLDYLESLKTSIKKTI
jgi:hypothetical protein